MKDKIALSYKGSAHCPLAALSNTVYLKTPANILVLRFAVSFGRSEIAKTSVKLSALSLVLASPQLAKRAVGVQ
jgi:hypothetical protein